MIRGFPQTGLRIIQFLLCAIGIGVFVWAYSSPVFRDTEGIVKGSICLPIATGIAFIVLGVTIVGRLRMSGFWFSLALMGQAVALQMIEAGPRAEYQHYMRPISLLLKEHPYLFIFILVQAIFVLTGIRRFWADIKTFIFRVFRLWQLVVIGLVFFFSSAALSRYPSHYISELILATAIQIVNLCNIILVVMSLPEDAFGYLKRRFDRFSGEKGKGDEIASAGLDRFVWSASIWVILLAAILSFYSYERIPHIPDEYAYLYQAQYFADGYLTLPAPSVPEAFDIELMENDGGRWYSAQLPGWPAVLAIGVLCGFPWLVNPILAGINILFAYLLIQEFYNRLTARITVLLLCVSPWYIFMAMNFMNHTLTLTCALIATLALVRARKTGRAIWGWIGGFFLGFTSLIRPLEALALAGLLGVWAIGIGGRRLRYPAIAGLILGAILVGSVQLYYNYSITGDPLLFPFTAYTDKHYGVGSNALGFGPDRGTSFHWTTLDPFPGHGLRDIFINAALNIYSINIELFGWSIGSLLLILIALLSMKKSRADNIMIAVIVAIIGIHSFYWFNGGPDFGARYWYLTILPGVVLTVRGIQYLSHRLEIESLVVASPRVTGVLFGVLLLSLSTLVNYFPWRAIDKYHHYRLIRPDIGYLAERYKFGHSLVLIRGNRYVDYAAAAIFNPVRFTGDEPIYVWDKDPEVRRELLKSYPDRNIWIVNGPTITHKGFEVSDGPLTPSYLLSLKQGLHNNKTTQD